MAVSKVILNGTTLIDTTDKTVTAGSMLSGITALKNDGTTATGSIASKTSSDLTASNLTVTAPAGHYASAATKTLSDQNLVAGNIKKDVVIFGTTGTYEGGGGGYNPYNLPSGYTPYEYIESTGTQYIDTGYVPTADTEIVATTMRTSNRGYNYSDWGCRVDPPYTLYSGSYWRWGSAADKQATNLNSDIPYGPQTYRVNIQGVYDSLGAKKCDFGTVTWTSGTNTIYLFCSHENGSASRHSKVKFYYWAASENGVKQVEFIPAMRDADSVLGFYETVSGNFFTNAGSGTFTGGAYT